MCGARAGAEQERRGPLWLDHCDRNPSVRVMVRKSAVAHICLSSSSLHQPSACTPLLLLCTPRLVAALQREREKEKREKPLSLTQKNLEMHSTSLPTPTVSMALNHHASSPRRWTDATFGAASRFFFPFLSVVRRPFVLVVRVAPPFTVVHSTATASLHLCCSSSAVATSSPCCTCTRCSHSQH